MRLQELIARLEELRREAVRSDPEVYVTDTGRETLCQTWSAELDTDGDVRIVASGNIL